MRLRMMQICPFIHKVEEMSGPERSIKINDQSVNVIYCITCTSCQKLYIVETGRRLGDRFREQKCIFPKFIFQIDTLNPHVINERFSFN